MIPNGEGWNYFVIKKVLVLLRRTMSKHDGDLYCLNCLHSFAAEKKRKSHTKVCKKRFL